jgi:hypothetical protein
VGLLPLVRVLAVGRVRMMVSAVMLAVERLGGHLDNLGR